MKLAKQELKKKAQTVEMQVAKTILKDFLKVRIGNTEYNVKPPTLSVLFRISAIVSQFPQSETKMSSKPEDVLKHVLLNAYQYDGAGDIMATLVLGWHKYPTKEFIAEHEALSAQISDTLHPREFDELLQKLLNVQEVADFFALTATLSELNLIEGKRQDTDNLHTD